MWLKPYKRMGFPKKGCLRRSDAQDSCLLPCGSLGGMGLGWLRQGAVTTCSLLQLEDHEYKPLDPKDIRLPPPMPPSERLLAAVEAFYSPPSHDRPRNRYDAPGVQPGRWPQEGRLLSAPGLSSRVLLHQKLTAVTPSSLGWCEES